LNKLNIRVTLFYHKIQQVTKQYNFQAINICHLWACQQGRIEGPRPS